MFLLKSCVSKLAMATTPGPGNYNPETLKCQHVIRNKAKWEPVQVQCFVKGGDFCIRCQTILLGDYYKGASVSWCRECHPVLQGVRKCQYVKVRHCCFFHKHMGLNGITVHKTSLAKLRALNRKEHIMWIKFGSNSEHRHRICECPPFANVRPKKMSES